MFECGGSRDHLGFLMDFWDNFVKDIIQDSQTSIYTWSLAAVQLALDYAYISNPSPSRTLEVNCWSHNHVNN